MICIAFETIMFKIETMKGKNALKSEKIVSLLREIQFPGIPEKTGNPGKETLT
jgi:hypothetical protein